VSIPVFETEEDLALWPLRSPTLPPATHTNCWVLGTEKLTLIDPGSPWPKELDAMMNWVGDRVVERIFLTHHHYDHVSGAKALQERTGAPIAAHPMTAERVDFDVQEIWHEGQTLVSGSRSWKMIHTPGHAAGHLCLHDGSTVIAGDMVAGEGTILLDPSDGNLGDYLRSLARLAALHPARLLPAHGPSLQPASEVLKEYISHRLMRSQQIVAALDAARGPLSARALVPEIYRELDPRVFPIAELQILSHLLWLQEREVVEQSLGNQFLLINAMKLQTTLEVTPWED
jgi:ribonuclease/clavin/mitogillin